VIELQASSEPRSAAAGTPEPTGPASDDSARRLALVISARRHVDLADDGPDAGIDALARQLRPILAWARAVPQLTDGEAVRRGVTVARTRSLVGVPRRRTLVALQEVATVLGWHGPTADRLDSLAIEVGLRVRRTSGRRNLAGRRAD